MCVQQWGIQGMQLEHAAYTCVYMPYACEAICMLTSAMRFPGGSIFSFCSKLLVTQALTLGALAACCAKAASPSSTYWVGGATYSVRAPARCTCSASFQRRGTHAVAHGLTQLERRLQVQ